MVEEGWGDGRGWMDRGMDVGMDRRERKWLEVISCVYILGNFIVYL